MKQTEQATVGTVDAATGPRKATAARASTATIKDLWGSCPFNPSLEEHGKKATAPSAETLLELEIL